MRPYDIIKQKRDGLALAPEDIEALLSAYARGDIPDYQMSALLMAVFFRGMSAVELVAWTRAMLHSGQVLNLSGIPGIKVDKHSTGGVGDKVSLCLAPLVAALGVPVPMMSGRGLGHTGGTLDKLASIPNFRADLSPEECVALLREEGLALMGQTQMLVPADRRLYALRDVTATVDCLPLIASSIMSKKLAEGMDGLVLDVKVGSGAFLKKVEEARALARTLIALGEQMGKRVVALLTDMEQPLGLAVGNALELREALEVLCGGGPRDLVELTLALGAEMLLLGGKANDLEEGRVKIQGAIDSNAGLAKLSSVVQRQGGDVRVLEHTELLPTANRIKEVRAPKAGFVSRLDAETVGHAAVALGAGRATLESSIDPAVGFRLVRKMGDEVAQGDVLAFIEHNDEGLAQQSAQRLLSAYDIAPTRPAPRALILERLTEGVLA